MVRTVAEAIGQAWRNRWFVGCLAMLVVLAVGFEVRFRHSVIIKDALPLKKSLSQLDRTKLVYEEGGKTYSYRLEGQPVQFPPEMLDKLGTEEYVGWTLRLWDDAERRPTDQIFQLTVTYYTGKPDQVPHVPEECMLGSGFAQERSRIISVDLPGLLEKDRQAPLQMLLFRMSTQRAGEDCRLVLYTFRVCDEWQAERERVRFTLGNPLARYAYFSKVELDFPLPAGMSSEAVDRAVETGKRFLRVALPILVREHWPNWPSGDEPVRPKAGGAEGARPTTAPRS